MRSKLDELKCEATSEDPDLIFVVEAKPKNGKPTPAEVLELEGYTLHLSPCYMEADTRGAVIYSKDYLNVSLFENYVTCQFKDAIWVEIIGNSDKLLCGCIYRSGTPSKAKALDDQLHHVIKEMSSIGAYSDVVLVGDFNHPKIKWNTIEYENEQYIVGQPSEAEHDQKFVQCLEESSLTQHVTKPTRIREDQNPTLDDLILTKNSEIIEDLQHKSNLGRSDHLMLQFEIAFNISKPQEVKRPRLNYMRTDTAKFNEIMDRNWEEDFTGKSPEDAYNLFLQVYNRAVKESVPTTYVSTSSKYVKPPWMRPSTLKLIKKKHHMLIRFLNTRTEIDREAYKKIRNDVSRQVTVDRISYESNIAEETKGNVNAFWRYVNSKRKSRKSIPDLIKPDGSKATTDSQKAEVLNAQFSSVFTAEDTNNLPEPPQVNILKDLSFCTITPAKVIKKLKKLRSDKAPGPDGVHPHLLKTSPDSIGAALSIIFNISFQHQQLPSIWKTGTISALFKKGAKSEAKNYRPVSLTSIPCKIMESLIVDDIVEHLIYNNLKNINQHGFTKGKSTVTNLISALNIWTEALSHGFPVDIVYLDFEKAFDKVPHQRLLQHLSNYGIRGHVLGWITNFLSNRKQAVKVNTSLSSSSPVLSGVPQGSVLGPVLFLIFVTNISDHITNFISLFADDTKLFSYILEDENSIHSTSTLQEDLIMLTQWSEIMQMSFNLSKCHVMHLGNKNPRNQYSMFKSSHYKEKPSGTCYNLYFHDLDDVSQETDLGVCVDDELKFSDHISAKISKANKMLHVIKNTFKNLTPEIFKKLYTTLVRPHLEYATAVWSPQNKKDIMRIESVQRRATKMVPTLREGSYEERLKTLQLPTLEYRRIRQDLLLLWNIATRNISLDLQTYCPTCPEKKMLEEPQLRTTRGHSLKYRVQYHQGLRCNFFSSRIIPLWNRLLESTVTSENINIFKNKLAKDPSMPQMYTHEKSQPSTIR